MKRLNNFAVNLWVIVFSCVITFSIVEIAARVYLEKYTSLQKFQKYASVNQLKKRDLKKRKDFHRYLEYYPKPNWSRGKNKHNSLGYRGDEIDIPKPKGEFRIVCMGGSTTYTGKVEDYTLAYPALLEKELRAKGYDNVKVINSGIDGWSSYESLINFELRVLDLEPDMIIIYHATNDIHPRFVWPPEAYKGDNSGARAYNSKFTFWFRNINFISPIT